MADVAKVAFEVDSTGLNEYQTGMKGVAASNKEAAASATDLTAANQAVADSFDRMANKTGGRGSIPASLAMGLRDAGAAAKELNNVANAGGGFFALLKSDPAAAGNALRTGLVDVFNQIGAKAGTVFKDFTPALKEASQEAEGFALKGGEVAHGMHAIELAGRAAGVEMAGLGGYLRLARGGIELLAVALGGAALVGLEAMADKANLLKTQLGALFGEKIGSKAFDEIKESATKAGLSVEEVVPAVQTLTEAMRKMQAQRGLVFAPGEGGQAAAASMGLGITGAKDLAIEMTHLFQTTGEAADKASTDADKFFKDLLQNGALTAKQFETLPIQVRAAIAKAFQVDDVFKFQQQLELLPKSMQQVFMALSRNQDTIMGLKIPESIKNSWDELVKTAKELFAEVGESSHFSVVKTILNDLNDVLKDFVHNGGAKDLGQWIQDTIGAHPFTALKNDFAQFISDYEANVARAKALWESFKAFLYGDWNKGADTATPEQIAEATNQPTPTTSAQADLVATGAGRFRRATASSFDESGFQDLEKYFQDLTPAVKDTTNAVKDSDDTVKKSSSLWDTLGTALQTVYPGLTSFHNVLDLLTKASGEEAPNLQKMQTAVTDMVTPTQTESTNLSTLKTGLDQLGPSTTNAASAVAAAVQQINAAAQQAGQGGSGSGISAPLGSSSGGGGNADVNIPDSALGGIYTIPGGSSGTDSVSLQGRVTPGEILAVLPPGKASAGLLSLLQDTIGASPIKVGPGGASGSTSISSLTNTPGAVNVGGFADGGIVTTSIAAPTNYSELEQLSALAIAAQATSGQSTPILSSPIGVGGGLALTPAQVAKAAGTIQTGLANTVAASTATASGSSAATAATATPPAAGTILGSNGTSVNFVADGKGGITLARPSVSITGPSMGMQSTSGGGGKGGKGGGGDSGAAAFEKGAVSGYDPNYLGGGKGGPAGATSRVASGKAAKEAAGGGAGGAGPMTHIGTPTGPLGRAVPSSAEGVDLASTSQLPDLATGVFFPDVGGEVGGEAAPFGGEFPEGSGEAAPFGGASPDEGGTGPIDTGPIDTTPVEVGGEGAPLGGASPDDSGDGGGDGFFGRKGGVFFAGNFAGGGSFSVPDTPYGNRGTFVAPPGQTSRWPSGSGTDTVPVGLNATPGETISVHPAAGVSGTGTGSSPYGTMFSAAPSAAQAPLPAPTPPTQSIGASGTGAGGGVVIENFNVQTPDPQTFSSQMSRAAIRRATVSMVAGVSSG